MSGFVFPNGSRIAPRVTGNFGPRQSFWTPGGWTKPYHYGTDMAGWSTIHSATAGVVVYAGYNWNGLGYLVIVREANGDEWWYAHLAPNSFRVRVGQHIGAGTPLATMGTSGKSTGIHLHWEFHPGGGAAADAMQEARRRLASTAGGGSTPLPKPPTEEEIIMGAVEDIVRAIGASQTAVLSGIRRDNRFRKVSNEDRTINLLGRPGKVLRLADDAAIADQQMDLIAALNPLLFPPDELRGSLPKLSTTALLSLVDAWDPKGDHGFGEFVRNSYELTEGATMMERSDGRSYHYPSRQDVWANLQPVTLLYEGVRVVDLRKPNSAVLESGEVVALTPELVARANSQRPAGQTWR